MRSLEIRRVRASVALLLCCIACAATPFDPRPSARELVVRIVTFERSRLVGVSGLSRDLEGHLWMVPERAPRELVQLARDGTTLDEPIPIEGVPEDLDLEAIAWIDESTVALGTESRRLRTEDALLIARIASGRARVERSISVVYSTLWGIEPEPNEGLEGLCHSTGNLLFAAETVIDDGRRRYASIATHRLDTGETVAHRLEMTSTSGRISAVACRANGAQLDVLAIERDYDVSHVLRFAVPLSAPSTTITPDVHWDLGNIFTSLRNFEGIAFVSNDEVAIVSDNSSDRTPTTLAILRLSPGVLDASESAHP